VVIKRTSITITTIPAIAPVDNPPLTASFSSPSLVVGLATSVVDCVFTGGFSVFLALGLATLVEDCVGTGGFSVFVAVLACVGATVVSLSVDALTAVVVPIAPCEVRTGASVVALAVLLAAVVGGFDVPVLVLAVVGF